MQHSAFSCLGLVAMTLSEFNEVFGSPSFPKMVSCFVKVLHSLGQLNWDGVNGSSTSSGETNDSDWEFKTFPLRQLL